jgi:hypothetical protein
MGSARDGHLFDAGPDRGCDGGQGVEVEAVQGGGIAAEHGPALACRDVGGCPQGLGRVWRRPLGLGEPDETSRLCLEGVRVDSQLRAFVARLIHGVFQYEERVAGHHLVETGHGVVDGGRADEALPTAARQAA